MFRRVSLSLALALGILAGWQWLTWPDVATLAESEPSTSAFIEQHRRQSNRPIAYRWARYEDISDSLKHAVLVAEDINFFGHQGFAIDELRNAVRETLQDGRKLRGASTLTQQLAKNLWLSPSRNPWRKVKEVLLTRQLEEHLSKRRILELYLNLAQFGPNAFGAEASAREFFGISASRLSEGQAAELAAGLSRPSSWNPGSDSGGYRKRVDLIRKRMRRSRWLLNEL